jgi:membrane associated rhomboid family serine protease
MMEGFPIITVLVIGLTTIASYFGFKDENLVSKNVFDARKILRGKEYYRLLSSALFHVNWTHLLFNMFSFYAFAGYMEQALGSGSLLLLYLLSILGGGLLSLIINHNREYLALGASGGVSGVIFSSIFVFPGGSIIVFPIPIPIPPWLYAILFVLISMYGMRRQVGNIGHDAHLGGALTGLLFTFFAYPAVVLNDLTFFLVIVAAMVVFISYVIKNPSF